MKLTVQTIKNARPATKTRKLFDGGGLYLEVSPKGRKWWRLKYRFGGKEKKLALGVYPDVTLKEARDRRYQAKKLLEDGIDPSERRQSIRNEIKSQSANTFELVAREWFSTLLDKLLRRKPRELLLEVHQRHGLGDLFGLINGLLKYEHSAFSDHELDLVEWFTEGGDEFGSRILEKVNSARSFRLNKK